jgi:hypothetical protein
VPYTPFSSRSSTAARARACRPVTRESSFAARTAERISIAAFIANQAFRRANVRIDAGSGEMNRQAENLMETD